MFSFAKLTLALACVASAASAAALTIGSDVAFTFSANTTTTQVINAQDPNAAYIALHFSSLNLPDGATLELTTPDGIDSVTLTGQADGPFYAESLRGSSVVL
ncbi:hypothetical protein As57867_016605, partial [Aphanomyces stellatus]